MHIHKRKPADFYPTPPDVTVALVEWIGLRDDLVIWEPACGDGAMSNVLRRYSKDVIATDLREDVTGGKGGIDFLQADTIQADWVITNPPFSIAAEFIQKALSITPNVAMLLKATYWNAKGREPLFRARPPSWILPLTWRPAFLESERGKSPLMDVMWCVWQSGGNGETRFEPLLRPRFNMPVRNNLFAIDSALLDIL